ncbi:MAG: Glu-tRNA(Gln) amidotransferase subunit GatD [Candidatus Thermoplasmatota archaeon]|nr:Glu-tRNA(Gln) amidotransferase subunit GatD [Candidatus Thermoplasmatota archaeon]
MTVKEFAEFGSRLKIEHEGQILDVTFIKRDGNELVFKLSSGYNVRFSFNTVKLIESLEESHSSNNHSMEMATIGNGSRKISLLSTGGTISSKVDYATGAVKPTEDVSFILDSIRDIKDKITLKAKIIDSILSENMQPDNWIRTGRLVKKALDEDDAVILLHGTDTMSYTASALAFMFERQKGPIILTGSQRSSDRPSSDAFENIESSVRFSMERFGEVGICMHSSISDGSSSLIRGVRARKMHTTRRDAFRAIETGELGTIREKKVSLNNDIKHPDAENIFSDKLDQAAGIYYFNPLSNQEDLESFSSRKKAVVIMATGLGHVAERLLPKIRELTDAGKHFVITSQCLFGRVDLEVYASGRKLLAAGAVPLENMLPETALAKSMYVLAHYPDEFEKWMTKNLRGEISERSLLHGEI